MTIAIITISVLLLTSIYINVNLLRKNEDISDAFVEQQTLISIFRRKVEDTYEDIKVIDSRGAFESDDEIGTVFTSIKSAVEILRGEVEG
tara:strand:+ start:102 stop:371 length:270 start_codon:yes stop_codon:yes gene_type:complete